MSKSLAMLGGRVLTPEDLVESDLGVEGGLTSERLPEQADLVIEASSLLVAPGLIDLQINGGFGFDFTADPTSMWEVGRQLPATGVTSFLPTGRPPRPIRLG